jgi:hypothetical protein
MLKFLSNAPYLVTLNHLKKLRNLHLIILTQCRQCTNRQIRLCRFYSPNMNIRFIVNIFLGKTFLLP